VTQLLHIETSVFGPNGQSAQLAERFLARWHRFHPETSVTTRDLAAEPIPHLDGTAFSGFMSTAAERTEAQTIATERSDILIAEVRAADVIVIGMPLYNLGVPSTFKSWIDHIARAGETFRYTETGPEGLLTGKKVYVMAARGGVYQDTPYDTQTPYIRNILGLMGITDVSFVNAEGLAMGDDAKTAAISAAHARIDELLPANSLEGSAAA